MATSPIVYNQKTKDIANEGRADARYIGLLDQNRTRLNINSALTRRQDDQDVFRFRVTRGGKLGIGATVIKEGAVSNERNGDIRIEILDRSRRPIADSKATSGALKENYQKIQADKYELQNSDYYIRITRDKSIPKTEAVQYSIQLRNGTFREDFDTLETPPTITRAVPNKVLATSTVAQQLDQYRVSVLSEGSIFSTLSTLT